MSSPPSFVSDALIVTRDALIASIRDLLEKIVVAERTRSPQQHSKTLEVLSEQTRKTKDVIRHKVYLKTILDGYDKASLTSGNVVEPAAWEKDLPRLFSQDVLARRLAERLGNISNIVLPVTEVAWQRSPEEDSQSEDGSIDDEEGSDNDTEDEDSIAPNGYIRLVNFKRDELIIPLSPRSAATWPRVHPASKNLTRIKAARRSVPLSRTLSPNLLPLKPPQEVCMDPASLLAISLAEEQSKKKAELHKNSAKRVGSPTLLIEEAPSTKKARAHRIGNSDTPATRIIIFRSVEDPMLSSNDDNQVPHISVKEYPVYSHSESIQQLFKLKRADRNFDTEDKICYDPEHPNTQKPFDDKALYLNEWLKWSAQVGDASARQLLRSEPEDWFAAFVAWSLSIVTHIIDVPNCPWIKDRAIDLAKFLQGKPEYMPALKEIETRRKKFGTEVEDRQWRAGMHPQQIAEKNGVKTKGKKRGLGLEIVMVI